MATQRTLNILAALVWYGGGVILLIKGVSLLTEANGLAHDSRWAWGAGAIGVIAGALKARFLFARACRRNLARIASLDRPRIWQFYRPWFFAVLAFLAAGSANLSKMAHGSYIFLIVMGAVDLSIAVALLGSSIVFWKERAFVR